MKYFSRILAVACCMALFVGCGNNNVSTESDTLISSDLYEDISDNNTDNSDLESSENIESTTQESNQTTSSDKSKSTNKTSPSVEEYVNKTQFNKIVVGTVWCEADSNGKQPVGDYPTIFFLSDGTGTVWFKPNSGPTAMYFTYKIQNDGTIILDEDLNTPEWPHRKKITDAWKNIKLSLTRWEKGNMYILTVWLNDGSTIKYYEREPEILDDGSIKYGDGTIVKP